MKSQKLNFIGILVLLLFVQCGGSKKVSYELQRKASFQVLKADYKNWIGGVEGVRGTTFEIVINNPNIVIDTVYFRGNKIKPNVKTVDKTNLQITGNLRSKSKPVLILHKNPEKEFGNVAPAKNTDFPFELRKNELVLSYYQNNKIMYFKVELVKAETRFYQ